MDYLGDGAVDVVTDPEAEGYNAGDRGQNYAWAAVGYGDWIYVGTCYAAIGNTLSLMKSSLGDEFDDKVLKATFDALYNGTFFLEEADGGKPKGVLIKDQHQDRRDQGADVRHPQRPDPSVPQCH